MCSSLHYRFCKQLTLILFIAVSNIHLAPAAEKLPPGLPNLDSPSAIGVPKSNLQFPIRIENSNEIILVKYVNTQTMSDRFYYQWNPSSGKTSLLPLPKKLVVNKVVSNKNGLLFFGALRDKESGPSDSKFVFLVTKDNKVITTTSLVPRAYMSANIAVLPDQSVIVAGDYVTKGEHIEHSVAVERYSVSNAKLVVEQLPDLPFSTGRYAYSFVGLADNRVMVLGGNDSNYEGCSACVADTYILNVKNKQWVKGPKMVDARANATATLLPNGSVLVIGGWTHVKDQSNDVISDTTEQWNAATNTFSRSANLVTGMTTHQALWASGQEGKHLLVAGGKTHVIQSYDVAQNAWHLLSVLSQYVDKDPALTSFVFDKQTYLWINENKESDGNQGYWSLHALQLHLNDQDVASYVNLDYGITLNLHGYQFIPGAANQPSYVVGGFLSDSKKPLNLIQEIWPDGRMRAVQTMQSSSAEIVNLDSLPPLNRTRANDGDKNIVKTKKLTDGRIIVAGGSVKPYKIALLQPDSMSPESQDKYLNIGLLLPSRRYEIYNPITKTWHDSSPSVMAGGAVVIMDDGRVVKLSSVQEDVKTDKDGHFIETVRTNYRLEISSSDGTSWTDLGKKSPPLVALDDSDALPFIIQNELFLAGRHVIRQDKEGRRESTGIVQWLNSETKQWETLWESGLDDNQGNHDSRIIIRTLANGKHVVIPVRGF